MESRLLAIDVEVALPARREDYLATLVRELAEQSDESGAVVRHVREALLVDWQHVGTHKCALLLGRKLSG